MKKRSAVLTPKVKRQSAHTPLQERAALWVLRNRGELSRIAKQLEVSPQFVHMVLMGKRNSDEGKVESALRKAGAPLVG